MILITLILVLSQNSIFAAQGDKIVTVIADLTRDIYLDVVYLSIGFTTTVCVFHLVMIILNAGDEQARRSHIKSIIMAVFAWILINVFTFIIFQIFTLTGQNTPTDIFDAGGYGG